MSDFFESINQLLKKDYVSYAKKILDNPNNFSENIISYLKKNNIDLNDIVDTTGNERSISRDSFKEEKINIQNNSNDYENLFLRLNNIETIMTDIKEYLEKDN